jgi:diaminohydroxyphosphoribosylaminopyrimidine deaminase/5-amino-6-(5-phosphoribosylamino)uracil reductase
MFRCLELAALGNSNVAPNPMVGSVLVYNNTIIGEGYHQQYGQVHAEVNCINSVKETDKHLIPQSTLYVSLEPCSHFGKTPPCSDLIIASGIKKVVVGCRDSYVEVNGKGIEKLLQNGIDVTVGVLEADCKNLNKRFFTFHEKKRPYIILKWAETANGKMATNSNERLLISNDFSNRLVHKWRHEEAAILVGTNTALLDNPSLTNRLWHGKSPIRLVVDKHLQLPTSLHLFNQQQPTIVFNFIKQEVQHNLSFFLLNTQQTLLEQIVQAAFQLHSQSILVEGGGKLLQSFIDSGLWDEARVIVNENLILDEGLSAPILCHHAIIKKDTIFSDTITYFSNKNIGNKT